MVDAQVREQLAERAGQLERVEPDKRTAVQSWELTFSEFRDEFQLAMPSNMEASHLIRDGVALMRQSPQLQLCTSASVLGGLMTCAQLGLRPGVLGQIWLAPFRNSRLTEARRKAAKQGGKSPREVAEIEVYEASIIVGYKGLVTLAYRSGLVADIAANIVREGEPFSGSWEPRELRHGFALDKLPGKPIAYYTRMRTTSGGYDFYVMGELEAEAYRQQMLAGRGSTKTAWRDHPEAMKLKTTTRRLAPRMPLDTRMDVALSVDGGVRRDPTPSVDPVVAAELTDEIIDGEITEELDESPSNEGER